MTADLGNEFSRSLLIAELEKDETDVDRDTRTIAEAVTNGLPKYIKSLFNVHGVAMLAAHGFEVESIFQEREKEIEDKDERIGDKKVVRTINIGGQIIKVLKNGV